MYMYNGTLLLKLRLPFCEITHLFHPLPQESSLSISSVNFFNISGLSSRMSWTGESNEYEPVSCIGSFAGDVTPLEDPIEREG